LALNGNHDLMNLQVLCKDCHKLKHAKDGKAVFDTPHSAYGCKELSLKELYLKKTVRLKEDGSLCKINYIYDDGKIRIYHSAGKIDRIVDISDLEEPWL
jgi:hypothetical protein